MCGIMPSAVSECAPAADSVLSVAAQKSKSAVNANAARKRTAAAPVMVICQIVAFVLRKDPVKCRMEGKIAM